MGLSDHMVSGCLVYKEPPCCFLWCLHPFTFTPRMQENSLLGGFSVGDVLDGGHPDLCEGISHGSFVLPGLSS